MAVLLFPGVYAGELFLIEAEAEARNRGDACCDHFHIQLAFLGLGPPVSDWLASLGLDTPVMREDHATSHGCSATQSGQR